MFDMPLILGSPLAMVGLLALLIPLVIHLLSKARPRVVAFAHIAFIKVKTSPLLRQFRLTQLMLLCLRMLIIMLATLILAQLYWHNAWDSTKQQPNSHILLTKDWLHHATDIEKRTLSEQFKTANMVLVSTKNRNINKTHLTQLSTNNQQTPPLNIWSKVAEYSAQLPADEQITVYTTNRLKQFIGGTLSLPKGIEWKVKTLPVERVIQQHSANIKVIYDNSSESSLVYLRAAFEIINTHKSLNLNVTFISNEKLKDDSERSLEYDKIIHLREQGLTQKNRIFDEQWQHRYITQAELENIKQADFVLTLARLLYSSQTHSWWLENARLSRAQITLSTPISDEQLKTSSYKKSIYKGSSNKASPDKTIHSTSLHIWLVLMLVAIFILERWLSEWPTPQLKAGLGE